MRIQLRWNIFWFFNQHLVKYRQFLYALAAIVWNVLLLQLGLQGRTVHGSDRNWNVACLYQGIGTNREWSFSLSSVGGWFQLTFVLFVRTGDVRCSRFAIRRVCLHVSSSWHSDFVFCLGREERFLRLSVRWAGWYEGKTVGSAKLVLNVADISGLSW